jgi:predicted negative regulator of RcsB-dependent stress response
MTQKRITKQQMKEDHFVTAVFRAREWAEENLNTILIAAGALIIVAVAVWFFVGQSSRKSQESLDLLGRAEVEMRTNQAQVAVIDFQKVIDDFGGTPAAKLAAFKLANLYFSTNDFEKAEQAFRKYADDYAIDDISRLSALEGIAASLSASGKYLDAAKQYLEVARKDTTSATYEGDLFGAVSNAIKGNDQAIAKEAFGYLQKKGAASEKFRTAKILMIEKGFLVYDKGEYN